MASADYELIAAECGVPASAIEAIQYDSSPRRVAEVLGGVVAQDREIRTDREALEGARELLRAHLGLLCSLLLPAGPVGDAMRAEVLDACDGYRKGIEAIDKVLA